MEAKKDNENNNITIFTNRKRKNTMEEEKIQADGEEEEDDDDDDDDDDEEDRDFDPDESETSLSKPSVMEEDDGTKMGRMLRLDTHDIYTIRRTGAEWYGESSSRINARHAVKFKLRWCTGKARMRCVLSL